MSHQTGIKGEQWIIFLFSRLLIGLPPLPSVSVSCRLSSTHRMLSPVSRSLFVARNHLAHNTQNIAPPTQPPLPHPPTTNVCVRTCGSQTEGQVDEWARLTATTCRSVDRSRFPWLIYRNNSERDGCDGQPLPFHCPINPFWNVYCISWCWILCFVSDFFSSQRGAAQVLRKMQGRKNSSAQGFHREW